MLDATTTSAFATVADSVSHRFRDEVEPLTNYLVARARRDWRGGADQLGFITTAVNRDINTGALGAVESFEHERMTALALATSTQPTMVLVMRMACDGRRESSRLRSPKKLSSLGNEIAMKM
jgi:hypothetical protein